MNIVIAIAFAGFDDLGRSVSPLFLLLDHFLWCILQNIHRMQIWRTTRSSPGTSHESEASEVLVFCFDNVSPEKSCFVDGLVCLFRYAYEVLSS